MPSPWALCLGSATFLTSKDLEGRFLDESVPTCAASFFLKWRLSQQAETTVARHSLMSCMWTGFPNKFHYTRTTSSTHSNFLCLRVYACLDVTCHQHFWQNSQSFMHHCINTGDGTAAEQESAKKEHQGRKSSCQDMNLQPFDDESGAVPAELSQHQQWNVDVAHSTFYFFRPCLTASKKMQDFSRGRKCASCLPLINVEVTKVNMSIRLNSAGYRLIFPWAQSRCALDIQSSLLNVAWTMRTVLPGGVNILNWGCKKYCKMKRHKRLRLNAFHKAQFTWS